MGLTFGILYYCFCEGRNVQVRLALLGVRPLKLEELRPGLESTIRKLEYHKELRPDLKSTLRNLEYH